MFDSIEHVNIPTTFIILSKNMGNKKITEEDIQKAQDLVNSWREDAMKEVPVWNIKDFINFSILEKEHVIEYLKSREAKYLDSIITATITNPKLIKTNQETLLEIEAAMDSIDDKNSDEYIGFKATRMETINQIKSIKWDIENRTRLFKDYDLIITSIKESL